MIARFKIINSLALAMLLLLTACSSVEHSSRPDGLSTRMANSARTAVTRPSVWMPTAAAALFGLTDLDHRVSDWASRHTPVFDSVDNARRWSNDLQNAVRWTMYGSVLAVPSSEIAGPGKFRTLIVDAGASLSTDAVTNVLKHASDRERPNGRNRLSFPSGHASSTFANAKLASDNFRNLPPDWSERVSYSLSTMAVLTGWARIEAEQHYPSDVLFGAALGNFMADFFTGAFLSADQQPYIKIGTGYQGNTTMVQFSLRYD